MTKSDVKTGYWLFLLFAIDTDLPIYEPFDVHHGRVINQVKFYGTAKETGKSETETNDVHDCKITTTDDYDRLLEGKILEGSTHRDGAIYRKKWGFGTGGHYIDFADRRESKLSNSLFRPILRTLAIHVTDLYFFKIKSRG